jgi:hypothetical protein
VPPDDIFSSYSYQRCSSYSVEPDGTTECLKYNPMIMDVLTITPPFFYSYQCGSTLLTSYIPVHMYSVSLQVLSTIGTLIIIFSASSLTQFPSCLLALFPGVCWPAHWQRIGGSAIDLEKRRIRLIEPHQIISATMSHMILLLSFGLCSPVLCAYIALSLCLHLCGWLLLIGRFVATRIDEQGSASSPPSMDTGSLLTLPTLSCLSSYHPHCLSQKPLAMIRSSFS